MQWKILSLSRSLHTEAKGESPPAACQSNLTFSCAVEQSDGARLTNSTIFVRHGTTVNDTCRNKDYYTTSKTGDNTSAGNEMIITEATTRRPSPISDTSPSLDDIAVEDCVTLDVEDGKSIPFYFWSCYTIYVRSIIDDVRFPP